MIKYLHVCIVNLFRLGLVEYDSLKLVITQWVKNVYFPFKCWWNVWMNFFIDCFSLLMLCRYLIR